MLATRVATAVVAEIPLDQIVPSARNPRHRLNAVAELAESIRDHGLLQPVLVRPTAENGDGRAYELMAGHRRLAAVQLLGWTHVMASVRTVDADKAYLLTLVENLQREDLSPLEESQALETLLREHGWSVRQVAQAVNRSHSYVSRRLRVFDDPVLAPLVIQGKLSVSAAEEMLPLPGQRKRDLARRAAQQAWDRPDVRRAIQGGVVRSAPAAGSSLLSRTRAFRQALRDAVPGRLTESERRELRLAYRELGMLAKAPIEQQAYVIPPLPATAEERRG